MIETIYRLTNGVRKVVAGLRPFSESVWPGIRNDLFVAHESIYRFAAQFAVRRRVLDAGCGTGYGTSLLAAAGASSAIGVDLDRRNIAFAGRRYGLPDVEFQVADLERLDFAPASFGFVIASNSLEHLEDPASFLRTLTALLEPGGRALIAVPPIYTAHDSHVHEEIHYHRSNLLVGEWAALIADAGFRTSCYLHRTMRAPDFASHRPSALRVDDFEFTAVPAGELAMQPTITAIFLLER